MLWVGLEELNLRPCGSWGHHVDHLATVAQKCGQPQTPINTVHLSVQGHTFSLHDPRRWLRVVVYF